MKKGRKLYRVQCYPLYSLLLAMGNPTVDYFSLDVEVERDIYAYVSSMKGRLLKGRGAKDPSDDPLRQG